MIVTCVKGDLSWLQMSNAYPGTSYLNLVWAILLLQFPVIPITLNRLLCLMAIQQRKHRPSQKLRKHGEKMRNICTGLYCFLIYCLPHPRECIFVFSYVILCEKILCERLSHLTEDDDELHCCYKRNDTVILNSVLNHLGSDRLLSNIRLSHCC